MQKVTLSPNESIEINGVVINTDFLKIVKNVQVQNNKPADLFFKVFHPAERQTPVENNQYLLLLDQKIEYLERILLDHELCLDGFAAYIAIQDEFHSLAAEYSEAKRINDYLEIIRPGILQTIDIIEKDIENLKLEIEAERESPSNVPMALRLHSRLGHL